MPEVLTIRHSDGPETRVPLQRRVARIGSADGCEVQIPHAEVAPHAATVDFRGGVYLLQNLNPYAVYLGAEAVPSEKWVTWPVGQELRLTRSVSLRLDASSTDGAASAAELDEEGPPPQAKQRKQMIQIVVIVICVVLGALLMTAEEAAPAPSSDSFHELAEALATKKDMSYQDQVLLGYLQEAWMAERRQAAGNRQEVVRAYQLLLRHPLISEAPSEGTTLETRIKNFASHRLAAIDTQGGSI